MVATIVSVLLESSNMSTIKLIVNTYVPQSEKMCWSILWMVYPEQQNHLFTNDFWQLHIITHVNTWLYGKSSHVPRHDSMWPMPMATSTIAACVHAWQSVIH